MSHVGHRRKFKKPLDSGDNPDHITLGLLELRGRGGVTVRREQSVYVLAGACLI